jgi:hypothetical protein
VKENVLGIGFYRREQWQRLLETAVDAHILERTYDEWLEVLDSSLEKIKAQGIETELVEVNIEELLSFCNKNGIQNNASARSRFIAETFRKKSDYTET